jgi:hypothetical protein
MFPAPMHKKIFPSVVITKKGRFFHTLNIPLLSACPEHKISWIFTSFLPIKPDKRFYITLFGLSPRGIPDCIIHEGCINTLRYFLCSIP